MQLLQPLSLLGSRELLIHVSCGHEAAVLPLGRRTSAKCSFIIHPWQEQEQQQHSRDRPHKTHKDINMETPHVTF